MENKTILIGSHVSMNAPDFFEGSVKEALSYGANVFMFYTGAPQNTYRKPLEDLKISEGKKLIQENGIVQDKIIVHAPYIVNPANSLKPDLFDLSVKVITNELQRSAAFGSSIMVLHPGCSVGATPEAGIRSCAKALDLALSSDGTNVKIALETMAGKGSEIGRTFEEIRAIIDGCERKDRLGVCLDTCHISDAGYDIQDFDTILKEFDKIIGLDRLLVLHINDSKNPRNSHKDRHENIGYGEIGFDPINKIVHHPQLVNIPKILETPYFNEKPPYKQEIKMLRDGSFKENWRDEL